MMTRSAQTEGRRGSPRRLEEGGRYLGIPPNGDFVTLRDGRDGVDDHDCRLLSVQETGCGTLAINPFLPLDDGPISLVRSTVRIGFLPSTFSSMFSS
jgi:hypothetical protein